MRKLILICVAVTALGGGYILLKQEHERQVQLENNLRLKRAEDRWSKTQAQIIYNAMQEREEKQRRINEEIRQDMRLEQVMRNVRRNQNCRTVVSGNVLNTTCD